MSTGTPTDRPPSVSVIVPLYNKRPYIAAAVESVLAQDTGDYEIIVVDDGSTDDPLAALDPYRDHIKYLTQPNSGPGAARNLGIANARGRYISFLDADDSWKPQKLSMQLNFMEANPGIAWTTVNMLEVDAESGSPLGAHVEAPTDLAEGDHWRVFDDWFEANAERQILRTSGVMVRSEAFAEAGNFDPEIFSGQDLDLWIRIARRFPEFAICLAPLVEYRVDVPGCITQSGERKLQSKLAYMKNRFQEVNPDSLSDAERRFFSMEFYNLAVWALAAGNTEITRAVLKLIPGSWSGRWNRVRRLSVLPGSVLRFGFNLRRRLKGV